MKPLGPVPPCFGCRDGELTIAGHTASALIKQAGDTPLFVYSGEAIRAKFAALRAVMPERLAIHYAVKPNSNRPILKLMAELAEDFDLASGGELGIVREADIEAFLMSL